MDPWISRMLLRDIEDSQYAPTPDQMALAQQADAIFTPVIWGVFFNLIFFGISTMQVYIYFSSCSTDKTWMKYYIAAIYFFDSVGSSFDMTFIYVTLVKHFGFPVSVQQASWRMSWSCSTFARPLRFPRLSIAFFCNRAVTGLVAFLIQTFFCRRIYILTKNRFMAGSIFITSGVGFAASVAVTVLAFKYTNYLDLYKAKGAVTTWLIASTVCDVLITVSLVWFLRKNKTGNARTDDIVDRIIRLSVQTGLITSVVATADVTLYLALSDRNTAHLALNTILPKLYVNSLLSSLNMRRGWAFASAQLPSSLGYDQSSSRPREDVILGFSGVHSPRVFITVESFQARDEAAALAAKSEEQGRRTRPQSVVHEDDDKFDHTGTLSLAN
ncbi:hypothetical protein OF83DRAFT_339338 [Amylostereum chailletii]|nr:hypothetical protein OF83DRAFT_339338 [Amylostereum chailletii]